MLAARVCRVLPNAAASQAGHGAVCARVARAFAEDGGPDGSIALHSLAGFAWLALGAQRGLELMLAYLSLVTCPRTTRCAATAGAGGRRSPGRRGHGGSAVVTRSLGTVSVNHAVQRLVVAHVACEWVVACGVRRF